MVSAGNILLSFASSAIYETNRTGWFKKDPTMLPRRDASPMVDSSKVVQTPVTDNGAEAAVVDAV